MQGFLKFTMYLKGTVRLISLYNIEILKAN